MPVSLVKDLMAIHLTFEELQAEEIEKNRKKLERRGNV